jgi:hypothetical protein
MRFWGFQSKRMENTSSHLTRATASKGPVVVVAVGSGVGESIFRNVNGALAVFFGGIGASLVIVLAVLIKRVREKEKIRELGQAQV